MSELPASVEEVEEPTDPEELREKRLSLLFSRALSGAMSKGPGRRYWQTDKLNARHLRIIQMRAAGYKNYEIAEMLAVSQAWVSTILHQPESQEILAYLVSYAADEVLDLRTRIKAHAGEFFQHIVDVTRNTRNDKLRSDNSFKMLAIAGYSATERREIINTVHIDSQQAQALTNALNEAMELEEIDSVGRFTVLASELAYNDPTQIVETEVEPEPEEITEEKVA